jgi:hypothetical protein
MSLAPGTRLGPYAVASKLGEGGMGEVYRGTDTRLGREVAIKVLAATTASSSDALARFEREGRAIAALNHPNICTLFDVGADDGRSYLVMELLAGATLHQVLATGPLAIPTLIDHATALADALHAAHSRGIIHRDLKPANVFLTEQGTIKILDFGLAKADSDPYGEARTIDAALTGPGTALGTLSYMSPEQLRGEAVDARSDLFSLGLVLYEMATAHRAFSGKTFPEVSAAILHDAPARPRQLRAEIPEKLEEILLKALEKERDLRYQTAAELRGDLKRLKRGDHSDPAPASSMPAVAVAPLPSSSDAALAIGLARRHPMVLVGLALVTVAAAAITWWTVRQPGKADAPVPELAMQPLTFDGRAGHATISPDGRFIAYVRRDVQPSVVVKQLSSDSDVVILPPSSGALYDAPSVTPDGGFVDVLVRRRDAPGANPGILRVPFLGGTPRRIVDGAVSGIGWSPDGQRMAFVKLDRATQSTSLVVADAQGQNTRVLLTRRAPSYFANVQFNRGSGPPARPSWSTDGRWVAAVGINTSPGRVLNPGEIIEVDTESGAERSLRIVDGHISELAYLDAENLMGSFIDSALTRPEQWQLFSRTGPAVTLTRSLNDVQGIQLTADRNAGVAIQRTSRSSIAVGVIGGPYVEVVAESGAQPASATLDVRGHLFYTARVPSGWATFRTDGTAGSAALVAADLTAAVPSPDATFVIGSRPSIGLVRANADGSGTAVILEDALVFPRAFTPDGTGLVYISNKSGQQQPWMLSIADGGTRRLSDVTVGALRLWLSGDGRQVIFTTVGGAQVCAFPAFDPCQAVKVIAGPLSADGKTVFAVDPSDPRNIVAQPIDGGAPTPVTRFTDKEIGDFSLSPDRSRIAIMRTTRVSDVVLVKGLK